MVDYNGTLYRDARGLPFDNRGFRYGDAIFETLRVVAGEICFWEDHYFRMMAGMRILRMPIPLHFTPDFFRMAVERLSDRSDARVRISLFREAQGRYTPQGDAVGYLIEAEPLDPPAYTLSRERCEVTLFKDFYVQQGLLSNIKSTNRALNVVAGIFARENAYDNCLLLNDAKRLVGAVNGNVFLIAGDRLITPAAEQGCIKGVFRKNLLRLVEAQGLFEVDLRALSPFELVEAEEAFITNVISGITPITHYREKRFAVQKTEQLLARFNASI